MDQTFETGHCDFSVSRKKNKKTRKEKRAFACFVNDQLSVKMRMICVNNRGRAKDRHDIRDELKSETY